ncbi:hypothetical protein AVEN_68256-1 [Araneus ventricosus]|uniref:Reverse transcriptase domain-containing protein n=1 Tax=Araneus ventricosus TaxID=182803 RepID=A0A4Y2S8M1_ARAVE|nr:hypothetical protein AVEN_68256-1 [Araneus ventricosus]
MLQQQFYSSVLPKAWKHKIIIPIPKPNKDKTKLTSYRPIALTSVFCKIFEGILAHRITHFLTSQKKLNPNQHGFLPFRDNHTAIYKIYSAISEARKNKKFFVAVSLDIKSAYDSVHIDSGGLARLPACPMASGPPRKCGREAKKNSFSKTHKQNSPLPQGPCFGVRHPFLGIYCRRNSTSQTAGGRMPARRNGVLSTSFELPIIYRCFTSKPSGQGNRVSLL